MTTARVDAEFTAFVKDAEPRLPYGLAAAYGVEVADGLNWTINDALPGSCVSFYHLTAGWVCMSEPIDEFTLDLWTSPDGLTWDEVDTTSLPSPANLGGTGFSSTQQQVGDDTVVMRVTAGAGKTVTWVIQFL